MNEEQYNKNIIQMLYYVIKTYDTGLSREDIDSLDIMQQENAQLKQQLKDKDEKISQIFLIKKDILTRYKLQDGNDKSREFYYMQCIDLILNILESNKED